MYYILDSEFPMLADTTYYDIDDGVELEGIQSWASGLPFVVEPFETIKVPITRIGESVDEELVPIPFNDANMCLANAEIAQVLKKYEDCVILYPALLIDTETEEQYAYFAINIVQLVSKTSLNDSDGPHIARLKENKNSIVVSAQLKAELKQFAYITFSPLSN